MMLELIIQHHPTRFSFSPAQLSPVKGSHYIYTWHACALFLPKKSDVTLFTVATITPNLLSHFIPTTTLFFG
jgi:hypothetical protein